MSVDTWAGEHCEEAITTANLVSVTLLELDCVADA